MAKYVGDLDIVENQKKYNPHLTKLDNLEQTNSPICSFKERWNKQWKKYIYLF